MKENERTPNLFKIATSELSQDAFLVWFLKWSDNSFKNEKLHESSLEFLKSLLQDKVSENIEKVEVGRQKNRIDVWAKINNKYFLIIEDKKSTKEHSNQLETYKKTIEQELKVESNNWKIIPIYFKMEEQSDYKKVHNANYTIYSRKMMLSVILKYKGISDILDDYIQYIEDLNKDIESYKRMIFSDWTYYSWQGFYNELQNRLSGNWDYVPNPSGGFIGFWWHEKKIMLNNSQCTFYIQLEYNKLIIKLKTEDIVERKKLRNQARITLFQIAIQKGMQFKKYGRIGKWMGIAKLDGDYRIVSGSCSMSMPKTITILKNVENLLDELCQKLEVNL